MSDDERPPVSGGEEGHPVDRHAPDDTGSPERQRPRPEYGEYATPEEQRARMGLPPLHHGALQPHTAPVGSGPSYTGQGAGAGRDAGADGTPSHPQTRPVRTWDRALTWMLLAIGLLSLATSAGSYLNMVPAMQAAYQELGIGHFGAAAIARPAGIVLVVVQSVIWVATVLVSQRSLGRGRISFWIPLVGAVMSYIALVVVLLIVVLNDPGFVAYISQ